MYGLLITMHQDPGVEMPMLSVRGTRTPFDTRMEDEIRLAVLAMALQIARQMITRELIPGDDYSGPELEPSWEFRAAVQKLAGAGLLVNEPVLPFEEPDDD